MGRLSNYKKIKSCDPYSKKNGGKIDLPTVGIWGLGDNGRKTKKRSMKAEKMKAKKEKNKSIQQSSKKGKNSNNKFKNDDDGGFDIPPSDKDEFDMADLMGSVKRQKLETNDDMLGESTTYATSAATASSSSNSNNTNESESNNNTNNDEAAYDKVMTSTGNVANIPKTDQDESKVTRLLRLDKQAEQKSEKERKVSHARMEGESKRAYNKRAKAETRQIIKNSTIGPKNVEKQQRKNEFMKNKKKRKGRGGPSQNYASNNGYNNDDDDAAIDNDDKNENNRYRHSDPEKSFKEDVVNFGERAERPPTFRTIPRGAKSKDKSTSTKAQSAQTHTATTATKVSKKSKSNSKGSNGMSDAQVEAERNSMEIMRRRVQAQYAAIRSKRHHAGDFHL
jgi:hypothetical protein